MDHIGEAERAIESIGCGLFQVLAVLMLYVMCSLPAFFSSLFMVFGNYNPGWRCLDIENNTLSSVSFNYNDTITSAYYNLSGSTAVNHSGSRISDYSIGTCQDFSACRRVEFNPESSTIVTEWGLFCDRSWVLSVIICVQMMGMLVGANVAGQIQDTFGRKRTLYSALALDAVVHLVSSFSVSWEMFAALQFFSGGLATAMMTCYYVFLQEFLTIKWRGPVFGVPAFNTAGVLFALTSLVFKEWRYVQLTTMVVCIIAIIPAIWIPESLRWLEVNDKKAQFIQVANKIAKVNRKNPLPLENVNFIVARKEGKDNSQAIKRHTMLDLFHTGYRVYALIIAVQWFSVTSIFFAIYFGIKSLYGHFYINMLLMDLIELPFCFVRIIAPNLLGRKKATIAYFVVCTCCLYINTALFLYTSGTVKTTGTVVFAIIAKISIHAVFDLLYTYTPEIYPTVVRGLSVGWGSALARFGGFLSAFLIPNDPESYYINYAVMATMGLVCCIVTLGLPETKGKPLKETFDDPDTSTNYQINVDVCIDEKASDNKHNGHCDHEI